VVDLDPSLLARRSAEGTPPVCRSEDSIPNVARDRIGLKEPVVPGPEPPLLEEGSELLLADGHHFSPLLVSERFHRQRDQVTVPIDDTVSLENRQRHLLDPVLVVDDLALVTVKERHRHLAERRGAASIDQRSDEQRLIDMAHPHAVVDEVDQFLEREQRSSLVNETYVGQATRAARAC